MTIDSVEIVGDTANVNLSLTSGGGGLLGGGSYSQTVRVRLDREDGQWRITVPPQPYLIDSPRQAPAPPATPIPAPSPGPHPEAGDVNVARRVYFYGVAFASLVMLAIGLNGLGEILLDRLAGVLPGAGQEVSRPLSELTQSVALVLVGLPVWLLHWRLAQRAAEREEGEREALCAGCTFYAVLLTFALRWAFSANELLQTALGALLGADLSVGRGALGRALLAPPPGSPSPGPCGPITARWVVGDRRLVGEAGASATLRRWYVYGLAFAGLLVMLNGGPPARSVWPGSPWPQSPWGRRCWATPGPRARAGATTLVGLALWLAHWSGWAVQAGRGREGRDVSEQDVRSVLRPVYLFLALGVSVGFTLTALARMLYYGLARLLGVSQPGGEGGPPAAPAGWPPGHRCGVRNVLALPPGLRGVPGPGPAGAAGPNRSAPALRLPRLADRPGAPGDRRRGAPSGPWRTRRRTPRGRSTGRTGGGSR